MATRKQLKLMDRNLLGYYSRTEIALMLALALLEARGFGAASQRALGALFGHQPSALQRTCHMALDNGLIAAQFVGRNKLVALTKKGKEAINGAITRVTRFKHAAGKVS